MDFEKDIQNCLEVLKTGRTILYPTDTIWGLGCDATDSAAVEKVFNIKKRPETKSMIVLVADEKDVLKYVAAPDLAVFDYLRQNLKPTTVIYEGAIGLADNLVAADGSIAIRIVKDGFCRHLVKRYRKPVVSTSANLSGAPPPNSFTEIPDTLKNSVDYIVGYGQAETRKAEASAIIRWVKGAPVFIRP